MIACNQFGGNFASRCRLPCADGSRDVRRDVQAPAGLQVALRGEDVHVDAAALLAVRHRSPRVAVRRESHPGGLLELVGRRVRVR